MTDDAFKLGHFTGMADDGRSDDLSASPLGPNQFSDQVAPARTDANENAVIRHPTAQAAAQVKFNYHDGRPILEVELEKIEPNEFQPRRIFNEAKLRELADSIKTHGIIQPLVVIPKGQDRYEILVGERRFRAAKLAGLSKVPVFVNPVISSDAKLEIALIENVQRADLNPIEEGRAYQRLYKEFGLALPEIAQRVGKDKSTISNLMRLLNLPAEIQRALIEENITEGQARPLLSLKDPEEMLQMFRIILRDQMKVRDIEKKVREIKNRRIKVAEMFTPDPFLSSLENLLRNKLGTRVEVNKNAKGGKILIEFYSDEELNDIIKKIA